MMPLFKLVPAVDPSMRVHDSSGWVIFDSDGVEVCPADESVQGFSTGCRVELENNSQFLNTHPLESVAFAVDVPWRVGKYKQKYFVCCCVAGSNCKCHQHHMLLRLYLYALFAYGFSCNLLPILNIFFLCKLRQMLQTSPRPKGVFPLKMKL